MICVVLVEKKPAMQSLGTRDRIPPADHWSPVVLSFGRTSRKKVRGRLKKALPERFTSLCRSHKRPVCLRQSRGYHC